MLWASYPSWATLGILPSTLTPRGAGRKPRRLQGLEHPGPGAHAHSPEYGCRRRLPAWEMAGTMRMGLTADFWQPLMSDIQTLGLSEYLYRVRDTGDKALRRWVPGNRILHKLVSSLLNCYFSHEVWRYQKCNNTIWGLDQWLWSWQTQHLFIFIWSFIEI